MNLGSSTRYFGTVFANVFTVNSTVSTVGNITGGNILTGGIVSATGNITGGNILGGANVNATTHTGTTVSVTANITGGNVLTGGVVSATGNVTGNNLIGTSVVGSRSNIGISTNTVIDSFPTGAYRTAKYVISSKSDGGYQSVEVLLIQDGSNSFITIYGSVSTVSVDIVTLSSNIAAGAVKLYATTSQTNCTVNLIGTYVTD
jgi:hypothetical protein